jgi:hypothetical protein
MQGRDNARTVPGARQGAEGAERYFPAATTIHQKPPLAYTPWP